MSVSWKEYKGFKILYIDYRGMGEDEGIKNIESQAEFMKTLPDPVLVLGNYEGTYATGRFLDRAKELGKEIIERKTRKGALVGITGVKKLLLNIYNLASGGNLKACDSEEQALEYLINN
jgi:hypothetical protein